MLVDPIKWDQPKTSQMVALLGNLEIEGKVLILTESSKTNVHLSGRNLQHVRVLPFGDESAYDVLWAGTVLIERGALDNLKAKPAAAEPANADESGEEE